MPRGEEMSIQDRKITDAAVAAAGVQSQPDKLTGTAAQNKKVFDNLVTAVVKAAVNGLIDELTGTNAAAQLGIKTIPGFSAADVQTALEEIVAAMQDITQGSVAPGSITLAELAGEVTDEIDGKQPLTSTLPNGNVGDLAGTVYLPLYNATAGGNVKLNYNYLRNKLKSDILADKAVTTAMLADAVVTGEKLAALAVLSTHIAQGAVTTQKIAALAVTEALIAAEAVTAAKIAPGAVTEAKLADNIPYTKFGLVADQVRHIHIGTAEPTAETGADGDIYIQYSE